MKPYYEDSWVTLWHGDCRELLPKVEGVACVVTSPPYNQMASLPAVGTGLWGKSAGGAGFIQAWRDAGYEDALSEPEYQAGQLAVFTAIADACTPDASLFYNHQCRWRDGDILHPVRWFQPEGWRLRQEIIWDRCGGMMFNARMFVRFDERILWMVRGDKWKWNQGSVGLGTIWRIAREQQQQRKAHPVGYPAEIPARCIAATTEPGDIVLDPYAGGGSTLLAAKNLQRRAVGIEREERYCEIAAQRCSQETLDLGA